MGAVIAAIVIALLFLTSYMNSQNYYIVNTNDGVALQTGIFAPVGRDTLATVPGQVKSDIAGKTYTKNQAYEIMFNRHIEEADALLDVKGMPDYEEAKYILTKSMGFAIDENMETAAANRLNGIDLMIFLNQADLAASKGNYDAALDYLEEAEDLDLAPVQEKILEKRIETIQYLKSSQ